MKIEVQIQPYDALDASSFFSETSKADENSTDVFEGPIKMLGGGCRFFLYGRQP